jgi:hypothetical protein
MVISSAALLAVLLALWSCAATTTTAASGKKELCSNDVFQTFICPPEGQGPYPWILA